MGERTISRRNFLAGITATGALAAAGALAGCAPQAQAEGGKSGKADADAQGSWRDKPDMPADIAETLEADLVVVGAGNGGLVAATTAAQNGAKVIVLEKGGNIAAAREAIGALNSALEPDHVEDVPTLLNHANQTQAGDANMLLYKTWAEKSGEMIEWMKETLEPKGMLFPFEWHKPDDPHAYYPAMCYNPCMGEYNPDGPNYGAYAHLEVMNEVLGELGGEVMFMTPAKMLVQDESGKVCGVIAESKDKGVIQINAKNGVIVCTGGYGANDEMLQDLCPGNSNWCVLRDSVTEEGDGIRMALWAGAELEAGGACMIWNRGIMFDDTEFDGSYQGGDIFLPGSQPFLHVNANGERYGAEMPFEPMLTNARMNTPGNVAWSIFDSDYETYIMQQQPERYDRFTDGLDAVMEKWLGNGKLIKADTLDDLAKQLDIPADTFKATVERYNSMAEAGEDVDFDVPAQWLAPVKTAPFYATKNVCSTLTIPFGLHVNADSQVLTAEDEPIPGLFAIGNVQGDFFGKDYPVHCPGVSHGRCVTFGQLVGEACAKDTTIGELDFA